jgi:hypothetical protein
MSWLAEAGVPTEQKAYGDLLQKIASVDYGESAVSRSRWKVRDGRFDRATVSPSGNGNRIALHHFGTMIFPRFASACLSPMATLLVVAFAFLPSAVAGQTPGEMTKDVTVVGCVQREKNYHKERRRVDSGPFALGFGLGKKYMLVNAVRIKGHTPRPEKDSCSRETWGHVFELTDGEGKVKPFVGHWVEINGTRREVGGAGMFEIDVHSVRDYRPPVANAGP